MKGPFVHPTAIVEPGAQLAPDVSVGPYACIGPFVRLGRGCVLRPHAVVDGHTVLGEDNVVHPHAVLGGEPQDLKHRGEETALFIGDRNVFREGVTINVGTSLAGGETRIGDDNLFMANAHVAHDCRLGNRVILANNVMLAGHVTIHDGAILNGGAGIHHFTTIGRYAYIGGLSRITRDVPPYTIVEGHPSRVRGVNVIGLKRAGYSDCVVSAIKEAYKRIFRSDQPMRNVLDCLEREFAGLPEVMELVSFLRASGCGRQGRQGEDPDRRFHG